MQSSRLLIPSSFSLSFGAARRFARASEALKVQPLHLEPYNTRPVRVSSNCAVMSARRSFLLALMGG